MRGEEDGELECWNAENGNKWPQRATNGPGKWPTESRSPHASHHAASNDGERYPNKSGILAAALPLGLLFRQAALANGPPRRTGAASVRRVPTISIHESKRHLWAQPRR